MSHFKAWVTWVNFQIIHFHTIAFSNRSSLDCVFKYLRFHDSLHGRCMNKGENGSMKLGPVRPNFELPVPQLGLGLGQHHTILTSVAYFRRLNNKKVKSLTCFIYFSPYSHGLDQENCGCFPNLLQQV